MRNVVAIAICLAGGTMFLGCEKEDNADAPPVNDTKIPEFRPRGTRITSDFYIMGNTVYESVGGYSAYSINGVKHELTQRGMPYLIYALEKNVYLAGNTDEGKPCYWINGEQTILSNSANDEVSGIYATKEDVYVCGNVFVGDNQYPCYWKNGVLNLLPQSYDGSSTTEIFVSKNGDVYVLAETIRYGVHPTMIYTGEICYWKNGTLHHLPMPTQLPIINDCNMGRMFVTDENDVYVVATCYTSYFFISYWKNGELIKNIDIAGYATGMYATDIFVLNNDVYICGRAQTGSDERACYWKNGKQIMLSSNKDSYASAIFVSENQDVYVLGKDKQFCYWKNGVNQGWFY